MHDPVDRPSWIARHWRWLLPVGAALGTTLTLGAVALLVHLVLSSFQGSEPYRHALAEAGRSAPVRAALGHPIEDGWMTTGQLSVSGASGHAALAIPIHGPRGRATLHVEATRRAGTWRYHALGVALEASGERIDLLDAAPGVPRPALSCREGPARPPEPRTPSPGPMPRR